MFKSIYYRLKYSDLFWQHVFNAKSKRLWQAGNYRLDDLSQRILSDLREKGIAITHVDDLFPKENLLPLMQEFVNKRLESEDVLQKALETEKNLTQRIEKDLGSKKVKKDFWFNIWPLKAEKSQFLKDNPFLKVILSDKALSIAGMYLGLVPKFLSFSMLKTLVVPESANAVWSQRWHRDPEDKKTVKMFIYMSDVNSAGAGPFSYVIDSQQTTGKYRNVAPQNLPTGSYPRAGVVENSVDGKDIFKAYGGPGTMIFCDTSGLHRGGFSTEKSRIMFMSGFASDASEYPRNFIYDQSDTDGLGRLGRLALRK